MEGTPKNDDTTKFIHKQTSAAFMRKGNARLGNWESFKPEDRSFIRTFSVLRFTVLLRTVVTQHPSLLVRHARLMCLYRCNRTNVRSQAILVIRKIPGYYLRWANIFVRVYFIFYFLKSCLTVRILQPCNNPIEYFEIVALCKLIDHQKFSSFVRFAIEHPPLCIVSLRSDSLVDLRKKKFN